MIDVKLIVNDLLPPMTMVVSPDVFALFVKDPELSEKILRKETWLTKIDMPEFKEDKE